MVLHKRSGYGFHGYEIPTMPRGCRSARKKRAIRYHVVNPTELCAIDLLATVAGKLLLEKDKSTTPRPRAPVVKAEDVAAIVPLWTDDKPAVKVEPCDQGSCDEGALVIRSQKLSHKHALKETTSQASTASAAFLGPVTSRVDALKPKTAVPDPAFPTPSNARHSPVMGASVSHKRDREFEAAPATPIRDNAHCKNSNSTNVLLTDQRNKAKEAAASSVKDSMNVDGNKSKPSPPSPALASSDSSVEVPGSYNCSPRRVMPRSSSIPRFSMDHDDNRDSEDGGEGSSSACTHPSTASPMAAAPTTAAALRPQQIGDRRIRKLLSSRFWKVGPSSLKEGEFYDRDMLRSKKLCYTRQKSHRSCFKRKKLLERSSVSSSSAGIAVEEAISKLSPDCNKKGAKGEQGHGTSSSITSHRTPLKSEDDKVELKIKSFKVPEVFIEMPETATVGSLKRAVLETVTAMLGNGLKVGVIYQGRKVRDDSRTLLQAGISGGDNPDSLNFSLEPNASSPAPHQPIPHGSSSCRAEPLPPIEQCRSPRPLATRLPAVSEIRADKGKSPCDRPDGRELQQLRYQSEPKIVVGLASPIGSDNNRSSQTIVGAASTNGSCHAEAEASGALVPSSTSPSLSKALVPVDPCIQSSSDLALAVVSASSNKMTRRPENGQRRIRRPFSVAEVEALVQAVEKLGTGRWRDVKLQAFDNAKHRTYVDLKDKWKTLVHTARISPQQRRGEPVPQELLDRVLVAHAHWSQHQARLQSSKHAANTSGGSGAAAPSPSCVAAGLLLPPPPTQAEQQPQPLALLPPPQAAAV